MISSVELDSTAGTLLVEIHRPGGGDFPASAGVAEITHDGEWGLTNAGVAYFDPAGAVSGESADLFFSVNDNILEMRR